ncbi:NAD(P)-binding domain-containing protein [Falsiroseomonas sp. E2-1-a20]|uniref:NAD(P)-binding domain-containing protein n=1 Tax=Falsiroseomonas sp. E2-1-a20 TaxID=3239300 RepID=UPI003F2D2BFA
MRSIDVAILGAGQAGLAMSQVLGRRGIGHVVLERGRIGERWRSERWDSLRLLTPNWLNRLPGQPWQGADPDGFLTMAELADWLETYARQGAAPVQAGTMVRSVRRFGSGYLVETSRGAWMAGAVVIATGHCDRPFVPGCARDLPAGVDQVTPTAYRNPASLPAGGVLVVGASASGVQIAEELRRAGRDVTLSVGSHTRLPRRFRGRDILWWMDRAGVLTDRAEAVGDLRRALAQPSLQLVGHPDGRTLDLGVLARIGVRLAGRSLGIEAGVLRLAADLPETTGAAQHRLDRLLARLDPVADAEGAPPEAWPAPLPPLPSGPQRLDFAAERIGTVVWATGFRRDYAWLRVPVLDADGEIRHRGGITPAAGLFVLGLRFLRHRSSSFIGGVGRDAEALADPIAQHLADRPRAAA